jgi:hypothetical protein
MANNRGMKKEEKIKALRELARQHPRIDYVGQLWKNPFNPRSTGRRWTNKDLELFRKFQREFR